jgi:phage shock protein A
MNSYEERQEARRARLEARAENAAGLSSQHSLFAEQFAQAEISRRPQYFAGEDFDQCRSDHR